VDRDVESDLPVPERPAIVEDLSQLKQEERMLSEALARPSPQYRRLIEMPFLETLSRPYAGVAADSGLEPGSIASDGRSASSICVGDSPNRDFDNATC
jgi:hypothetical protein